MGSVTVRDLRNHGGDVLDRVSRGDSFVVTRDGVQVAEIRPLRRSALSTAQLIERRRNLPRVDPDRLRHDLDELIDPRL